MNSLVLSTSTRSYLLDILSKITADCFAEGEDISSLFDMKLSSESDETYWCAICEGTCQGTCEGGCEGRCGGCGGCGGLQL